MKLDWRLLALLTTLLVVTAALTVSSRSWMLSSHRDLTEIKKRYNERLEEEHALQVELVTRTDMNTIERRARQELGMQPLKHDQWRMFQP